MRLLKFTILVSCAMSCSSSQPTDKISSMLGTYTFNYPSGEVEVLIIVDDSTYKKDIYKDAEQYKSKTEPIYTNTGNWSVVKENYSGIELEFYHWLMYNHLRYPDDILDKPYRTTMTGVTWEEPTKDHNGKLSVYYETGYEFTKLSE